MTTKSAIKVLWSMVLLFFRDVYTMHHRNVCVIIIIDHFYILPLLYITGFFSFSEMFTRCITGMCVLLLSLITLLLLFQALKQTCCIYELNALPIWTSALATITICSDRDLHQGPM